MKITKKNLEKIIKEEVASILQEQEMTTEEAIEIIQKLTAQVRKLEKEIEKQTLKPGELRVGPNEPPKYGPDAMSFGPGLPNTTKPDLVIKRRPLKEQTAPMSLPPIDQLSDNPTQAILARDLNVALQQLDQKLDQILARLDQK